MIYECPEIRKIIETTRFGTINTSSVINYK